MTSNNLFELRSFLEQTGAQDRTNLQRVIGGGFTNSPEHLCDHIQYLRASFFGQWFDDRPYKQLVTDVADHIGIDWSGLFPNRHWNDLSAGDIEDAVVVTSFQRIYGKLSDEDRSRLAEELSKKAKDPNFMADLLSGGAIALARLSGFKIYLLATTAVHAFTSRLGITLPFVIYTATTRGIRIAIGPIGWALIAIPILFNLSQPDWEHLVPGVIYISYIRHKRASEL